MQVNLIVVKKPDPEDSSKVYKNYYLDINGQFVPIRVAVSKDAKDSYKIRCFTLLEGHADVQAPKVFDHPIVAKTETK